MMRIPAVLLVFATVSIAAPWKAQPGPYEVSSVATLTLGDKTRGIAEFPVRITYPAPAKTRTDADKHPVIVFSHGMFGSKDNYQPLVTFWAAHGYVVFQPTHPDSRKLGLKTANAAARAWKVRPRQVSFLLDSLDLIEKQVPALADRLDRERIGVGGHSFGAHTSQLIGGAVAYAPNARSFRDKRCKAALLLSPQGKGGVFRADSWKTLTLPALVLTGSLDTSPITGQKPEWRLDPFRLAPPGDRYVVWIEGAHHGFGGISGSRWRGAGPKNDDQVRVVQQVSLAFFDAFLRDDAKARRWLATGAIGKDGAIEVRCENRLPTERAAPPDRR